MEMKWLTNLERKFYRYAIPNLMQYIVGGQIVVWALVMFINANLLNLLALNRFGLFSGQVWRLLTFVFIPDSYDMLYFALGCYFNWMIGTALERSWGAGWFNLYYLFGMLGAWLGCFVTGYGSSYCLSLSLFLAFAILYPEMEFLLFFVLPVKAKWLGWLSAALWGWNFITASWAGKLNLALGMLGFGLFFGPRVWHNLQAWQRRRRWQQRNRR